MTKSHFVLAFAARLPRPRTGCPIRRSTPAAMVVLAINTAMLLPGCLDRRFLQIALDRNGSAFAISENLCPGRLIARRLFPRAPARAVESAAQFLGRTVLFMRPPGMIG